MLAIPSMIAQLVNVLYNIVDRIYVGNLESIGQIALVGVGVVAPISTLITSFGFLVGLGGAPLFSIALGEKNNEKAKKILSNALLMLIILSTLVMVIFYAFMDNILLAFGATPDSFEYAKEYFLIYLAGCFFSIITLGLNQYLTAQGQSKKAMLTTLIGCTLNVGLDPLFMYAFKMGVKGAAVSTLICQIFSFVFVLLTLIFNKGIKLSFGKYDIKTMLNITKVGLSPFLINATDSIVFIVLNIVLKQFSSNTNDANMYLEIATIVIAFESLITGPLLGISTGTQPILGYNYGAKNKKLLIRAQKQIFILAASFCIFAFGLSFLISKPFASMFINLTKSADGNTDLIIDKAAHFIFIYMIGIIPLAFQYCAVDGLTAIGKAKYSIWLSLNRKIVLLLPLTFLIPLIFKDVETSFFAEPIADVIGSIITITVYLIIFPKIMNSLKDENHNDSNLLLNKTS